MIPYSQLVGYLVIPIHHKLHIALNTKDHNRITLAEKSPLRSTRPYYKINLFQYFGKKMNIALIMYIVILMKTTSLSLCYVTAFGLFSSRLKQSTILLTYKISCVIIQTVFMKRCVNKLQSLNYFKDTRRKIKRYLYCR